MIFRCNYLDDKWIIRFAALDRLGGCTNVMEKRRSASISTSITTCKTVFVSLSIALNVMRICFPVLYDVDHRLWVIIYGPFCIDHMIWYVSLLIYFLQEKKDGYVRIENNLHIFRNIEENIFDESVYPLSCSYKGMFYSSFNLNDKLL